MTGTFTLNHRESQWEDGLTIAKLIERENFKFKMLVVKINGELVKRPQYESAIIPEGADVEVIHLISGG